MLVAAAYDAAGNLGIDLMILTVDNLSPSAPRGVSPLGGAGNISVSWTASTDNNAVTSYEILRKNLEGKPNVFSVTGQASFSTVH